MSATIDDVPNPGSEAAFAQGCTCPILDNNHGKGSDWGDGKFWITARCPLHDDQEATSTTSEQDHTHVCGRCEDSWVHADDECEPVDARPQRATCPICQEG